MDDELDAIRARFPGALEQMRVVLVDESVNSPEHATARSSGGRHDL